MSATKTSMVIGRQVRWSQLWPCASVLTTSAAEPRTEYDMLVYGELGTLVHTEGGRTGVSWTYAQAQEIAESGLGWLSSHLRVRVRTWGASRTHEAIREIEWEFEWT